MPHSYELGPGADPTQVIGTLNHLIVEVSQCFGPTPGQRRDQYLAWVENAETQLHHVFRDRRVADHLLTDRYWHIRHMSDGDKRPIPLIDGEVAVQKEFIVRLAAQIQTELSAFGVPAGTVPLVIDTNVLLHYRHFDQATWRDIAGGRRVRLVIPLIVIDELDTKSYASTSTAPRAKKVLRSMQQSRRDASAEQPVDLRDGVDWQILMDPPGHERAANADEELLRRADHLDRITPGVVVASADYGIRLRAQARGLGTTTPPDTWKIRPDAPTNAATVPAQVLPS